MAAASKALYKVAESPPDTQSLIIVLHDLDSSSLLSHIWSRLPRRLAFLQLLVEPDKDAPECKAAHNGDSKHGQHNSVALSEAVVAQAPDVGSCDIAKLTERVDHRDGDGTFGGWARERRADP